MFFNFIAIAVGEIGIIHNKEWEMNKTNDLIRSGKSYLCFLEPTSWLVSYLSFFGFSSRESVLTGSVS